MEVSVAKSFALLYLGDNVRFSTEFSRAREDVLVSDWTTAKSAIECLQRSTEIPKGEWVNGGPRVDAILIDQSIPENEVQEFRDYLNKTFDPGGVIPLIFLGKDMTKDEKIQALNHGYDDVFIHPVSFDQVTERIDFLKSLKSNLRKQQIFANYKEDFKPYKIGFFKRTFDILLASTVLLCAAPFLLLVILAIRLESRGKVYYISKRVGTGYKIFNFLKLRSMYPDADQRLKEFQHLNQYAHETTTDEVIADVIDSFSEDSGATKLVSDDDLIDEHLHNKKKKTNQ